MPSRTAATLADPKILGPAVTDAFRKLDPRVMVRNPVMFTVEVVASLGKAWKIQVKGQNLVRTSATLDAFVANSGLNGMPLLAPFANFVGGRLLIIDIRAGAEPSDDVPRAVSHRQRANQKPVISARSIADTKLDRIRLARLQ